MLLLSTIVAFIIIGCTLVRVSNCPNRELSMDKYTFLEEFGELVELAGVILFTVVYVFILNRLLTDILWFLPLLMLLVVLSIIETYVVENLRRIGQLKEILEQEIFRLKTILVFKYKITLEAAERHSEYEDGLMDLLKLSLEELRELNSELHDLTDMLLVNAITPELSINYDIVASQLKEHCSVYHTALDKYNELHTKPFIRMFRPAKYSYVYSISET